MMFELSKNPKLSGPIKINLPFMLSLLSSSSSTHYLLNLVMDSPAISKRSSPLTIFYLLFLSFLAIFNLVAASEKCDFPAIFNFGDSNSDTGAVSAAFFLATPPNGETFFHTPAGRYSDGRLIIDFIAKNFELPYLSAYLDSLGSNFSHGSNFATSASTITPQKRGFTEGGFSPFYLDVQFWQFSQFKSRSQTLIKNGGLFKELMPKEEYFSKALYTFDIGQNDLGAGFFGNKTMQEVNATIPEIIQKFLVDVKDIYDSGARSFWIHNTGPIGCLTYILANFPITADEIDDAGCAKLYNDVAQYFNKKLKEAIAQLRKDLPLAAITYVDVYSVKYSLFRYPKKYGFELPHVACCGYGGKYNYSPTAGCGWTVKINGISRVIGSCGDPSVRVIWDGIHYTEAANKFIFDRISTGEFSDPPIPLNLACHKKLI